MDTEQTEDLFTDLDEDRRIKRREDIVRQELVILLSSFLSSQYNWYYKIPGPWYSTIATATKATCDGKNHIWKNRLKLDLVEMNHLF